MHFLFTFISFFSDQMTFFSDQTALCADRTTPIVRLRHPNPDVPENGVAPC